MNIQSKIRIWEGSADPAGISIDDCLALAEHELSAKRFEHSIGVMNVMAELAPIYALNEAMARVCGILHDVAKEFPLERQLDVAGRHRISLHTEFDRHPMFLHGPVGACYVVEELGRIDPIILDAIVHHSYFGNGSALSTSLCWCLRFSDILEPSRDWHAIKQQLKPLVYAGRMKEGAHLLMNWAIGFHESISIPVHPNMQRVFRELSSLMNENSSDEIDSLPV